MVAVPVVKMNGTENDFLVVDERATPLADPIAFARRWCERTSGVGADGVLLVGASSHDDARMRVINADGSEAEMCGNGVRCVARYLYETEGGEHKTIETLAGPIATDVVGTSPDFTVRVAMGRPRVAGIRWLDLADGSRIAYAFVDVGNPHAVIFVDDPAKIDIETLGREIETHPMFPHGANVHFVAIAGPSWLRVRHWERGSGATRACGTGAVAAAAAAVVVHQLQSPVAVDVPGGRLSVDWTPGQPALLTGNAVRESDRTLEG